MLPILSHTLVWSQYFLSFKNCSVIGSTSVIIFVCPFYVLESLLVVKVQYCLQIHHSDRCSIAIYFELHVHVYSPLRFLKTTIPNLFISLSILCHHFSFFLLIHRSFFLCSHHTTYIRLKFIGDRNYRIPNRPCLEKLQLHTTLKVSTYYFSIVMSPTSSVFLLLLLFGETWRRNFGYDLAKSTNDTPGKNNLTFTVQKENITDLFPSFTIQQFPNLLERLIDKVIEKSREDLQRISKDFETKFRVLLSAIGDLRPAPWLKFNGMTLMFVSEHKNWTEAELHCERNGGFLAWFQSASEHETANAFCRKYPSYNWYHIGLYRKNENSSFQWSSGSWSPYRGSRFTDEDQVAFASNKCYRRIDGGTMDEKWPSLCRRPWTTMNHFHLASY